MGKTEFWLFPCFFTPNTATKTTGKVVFFEQEYKDGIAGFQVRLRASPTAVKDQLLTWGEVDVDGHQSADLRFMSTIGPEVPPGDPREGIALSTTFHGNLVDGGPSGPRKPTLPPEGFETTSRDYEFKSVQYWDNPGEVPPLRRYRGFHAKVIRQLGGGKAELEIWQAGYSKDAGASSILETIDWGYCDPPNNGYSMVHSGSPANAEGALFIQTTYAYVTLKLEAGPKLPIGYAHPTHAWLKQTWALGSYELQLEKLLFWSVRDFRFDATSLPAIAASLKPYEYRPRGRGFTLDLIGHTAGMQELMELDGKLLDAKRASGLKPFFQDPAFRKLRIGRIRLLGCGTARTKEGKEAIVALADAAGIPVYGTRGDITNAHFDAAGFRKELEDQLVSDAQLRKSVVVNGPGVALNAPDILERRHLADGWHAPFIDPKSEELRPRPLSKPDVLVYRTQTSIQAEINYRLKTLRVWSDDWHPHGLTYSITDEAGLRQYVEEQLPPLVTV